MAWERVAALSALLLALPGPELLAQAASEPVQGSKVRIRTVDGGKHWIEGTVVSFDASRVTLQRSTRVPAEAIERDQVSRLDISSGHGRRKGAGIGALVGLSLAGGLTLMAAASDTDDLCSGSGCIGLFFILGVPAAATGALIGAAVAPERWREVPLVSTKTIAARGPIGLALTSARGGGRSLGVSLRF